MSPRLQDLSPADQKAVKAALGMGSKTVRKRAGLSRAGAGTGGSSPVGCGCGEMFEGWKAAVAHQDAVHGGRGRLSVDLGKGEKK